MAMTTARMRLLTDNNDPHNVRDGFCRCGRAVYEGQKKCRRCRSYGRKIAQRAERITAVSL